ncbi:MAG: choice-of-anchor Q domain-containing protein [Verrucomicrobiota bacterium]|nr:choice-of-anchor Q domain-containing protein [Verrucomicrobiota bacterium]
MKFLLAWFLAVAPVSAQTLLSNCTEENLRNAVAQGGVIQFDCTTEIVLTSPLVIEQDVTLEGTNAAVALSGNNLTRLFIVRPGVSLTLRSIGLFSGQMSATNLNNGGIAEMAGAAIYNDGGNVTLFNVTIRNHAINGSNGREGQVTLEGTGENGGNGESVKGGAIYSRNGTVNLELCDVELNTIIAGNGGKGANGQVRGNGNDGGNGGSGGSAQGGAIYMEDGMLSIINCSFGTNKVTGGTAGLGGSGSGLLGFNGTPGQAGAAMGGAIYVNSGVVAIYGSTINANVIIGGNGAGGLPGLRAEEGFDATGGGTVMGAGIFNGGSLFATNSTIYGNSGTGGTGASGGAGGAGSFGGDGGNGGNGGSALGGGIYNSLTAFLNHCTVANNTVTAGQGGAAGAGGGVLGEAGQAGSAGVRAGANLNNQGTEFRLANSIINQGTGGNGQGTFVDLGGNISNDTTISLNHSTSLPNADPRLRTLANNGGPTLTAALATNSPAIDKGNPAFCLTLDQRGTNRVANCDIGAYELFNPILTNQLTASLQTNQLVLSWDKALNVDLERSTNLSLTNWTTASPTRTTNGNTVTVKTTTTNLPAAFYRLRKK